VYSFFNDKNLLILTALYPDEKNNVISEPFVKVQVDELKNYFRRIYVISQTPYFPRIMSGIKYVPVMLRNYGRVEDYSYDNVEVHYPRYFTFPPGFFNKFRGESCYRAIRKLIKRKNIDFDLIHAHFTWPSGYVGVKLKKDFGKKIVLTTHGLHKNRLRKLMEDQFALETWRNADLIHVVTPKQADLLVDTGISEQTLEHIPNSIDLSEFHPISYAAKQLNIKKQGKIIITVGNLIELKGVEYLIRSLKMLKDLRNDFTCYIIGEGPLEHKLNALIDELRMQDNIKLLGPIPHDSIPLWMNLADLLVLNSFSETFGVVNIEALACGTPVVSTVNGGSEHIITSEDYGLLIDSPKNIRALSGRINQALNKKWSPNKMIQHAEQYRAEYLAEEILDSYKKLLI
jgi:teichuronic acid biosynthesis glycosyltransferase TuaC